MAVWRTNNVYYIVLCVCLHSTTGLASYWLWWYIVECMIQSLSIYRLVWIQLYDMDGFGHWCDFGCFPTITGSVPPSDREQWGTVLTATGIPLTSWELLTCGLEWHLHNVDIVVRGSQVEDGEDVLPTRHDVWSPCTNHLCHTAYHHVTNGHRPEYREKSWIEKITITIPLSTPLHAHTHTHTQTVDQSHPSKNL